jgi:uncharacterized phage protein gp47/JayE
MTSGLTPTGFIAKTQQEIVTDINTQILNTIDPGLDLSADQPMGQLIGIFAEKIAEEWEAVATAYNEMDPDAAEGYLLDALCALTGTRRQTATYSTVTVTLNLNSGTTVNAGSTASVANQPANVWVAESTVTNSGGSTADFTTTFRSQNPGPFVANASTLTVISSPVIGWNSITNPGDAILGVATDSDPVLRVKRQAELSAAGACTTDAIRADVLEVAGVLQCFVLENTSDVADGNGLPPHSFDVIIWDGSSPQASNTAIAQAIWNDKPTGIPTHGSISANATDSQGNSRSVNFDRASQVPIYMSLTVTRGPTYPSNGDALVQAALAAYASANLNLGVEVVALAFRAAALTVPGVLDVPVFTLGTAPSPVGTANIPITQFQIATLSTSNVVVTDA